MTDIIRPYGPGKFSTILDSYVYSVSLNGGPDDETTVNSSWYGVMRDGDSIFKDHDPFLESLNDAERAQLTSCAGVILREDSDGFVAVQYFDTRTELERAWDAVIEDASLEEN